MVQQTGMGPRVGMEAQLESGASWEAPASSALTALPARLQPLKNCLQPRGAGGRERIAPSTPKHTPSQPPPPPEYHTRTLLSHAESYSLKYPAPGHPKLAERIAEAVK